MMKLLIRGSWLVFAVILSACTTMNTKTITQSERDSGPDQPVSVHHIPDAIPRQEVRTIAGNKTPYRVLGKTYHVMPTPDGYKENGIASWYGRKFHGRKTSNGELYDMYGMTAAHKTLPIPSYVRVTNTKNQRSVIVRVNDRGPFHGGRIIDLTYTAAKKLGFENAGTAPVVVEYIDPHHYHSQTSQTQNTQVQNSQAQNGQEFKQAQSANQVAEPPAPSPLNSAGYQLPSNTFLQVGAFSSQALAQSLQSKLQQITHKKVWVLNPQPNVSAFYRVQIGPFTDNFELMNVRQSIINANYSAPHVVYR